MIKIREAIIVEGRYDKNKIKQIFDAPVIETGGFSIFSDREKLEFIRLLAQSRGILVLTDSDGPGFMIRNFLKGSLDGEKIKHAYIPDIFGKEKRKSGFSKEGKLGVEGIEDRIIIEAVKRAGVIPVPGNREGYKRITRGDLYESGLYGREDSAKLRRRLFKKLFLPERLSVGAFLDISDLILTREEFFAMADEILKSQDKEENL